MELNGIQWKKRAGRPGAEPHLDRRGSPQPVTMHLPSAKSRIGDISELRASFEAAPVISNHF